MKQTRMRERGIERFEAKISRVAIGGREVYAAARRGQNGQIATLIVTQTADSALPADDSPRS